MQLRIASIALSVFMLHVTSSLSQTPPVRPKFEVASIKPNPGCENNPSGGNLISPGRLQWPCITLERLIHNAYVTFPDGVSVNPADLELSGGPGWIRSERYSLAAKAEGAASVAQMAGPMLQSLLEERFKLKIRRETKEMPVYSLTVAKSGLKLQPTKEGGCTPIDPSHPPPAPSPGQPMPTFCGNIRAARSGTNLTLDGHGVPMPVFCQVLSSRVGRTVIDKTGLTDRFEVHLEYAPDDTPSGPGGRGGGGDSGNPAAVIAGSPIFDALGEQLGLKLVSDKGPVSSLVIDHVERPSEN